AGATATPRPAATRPASIARCAGTSSPPSCRAAVRAAAAARAAATARTDLQGRPVRSPDPGPDLALAGVVLALAARATVAATAARRVDVDRHRALVGGEAEVVEGAVVQGVGAREAGVRRVLDRRGIGQRREVAGGPVLRRVRGRAVRIRPLVERAGVRALE